MGGIIIALCIVVVSAAGGAYWWVWHGTPEINRATGCPKDAPASVTAVLLDVSDPLDAMQIADVDTFMQEIKRSVPRYGRLELYSLAPSLEKPLVPEYVGCNPGGGSDEDTPSPWFGNPRLLKQRWERDFSARVDQVLHRIMAEKSEDHSPILECMQSIAITSFGPLRQSRVPKQMIVVSDFLQYTKEINFYKGVPAFEVFVKSPYYQKVRTDFDNAEVTLAIIRRDSRKNIQTPALQDFWLKYVGAQSGIVSHWRPIQG